MKTKQRINKDEISRGLNFYLKEISKISPLSYEEEKKLWKLVKEGDEEALKKIIISNLRFVVSYAKKFRGLGLSFADLINEGNLGLLEAIQRYDPSKNVRFISYAVWWIRQAIISALARDKRIFSIPQRIASMYVKMGKKADQLKAKYERDPLREEIAKELNLSTEEVDRVYAVGDGNLQASLNGENGENIALQNILENELQSRIEYQHIKERLVRQIREALEGLDKREAKIIKMRYGLDDGNPKTLREIGETLNISRERVRQIIEQTKNKLKGTQTIQQLRGYLN
ncbi:MAG: RNA polymerase sigma factor RpoD/SigA [Acidobacteriota bacterium]